MFKMLKLIKKNVVSFIPFNGQITLTALKFIKHSEFCILLTTHALMIL